MTGFYRCEWCLGVAWEGVPSTTVKHDEDGVRHVFCKPECYAAWKEAQNGD